MNKIKVKRKIVTLVLIFSIFIVNTFISTNIIYAKTTSNKIVLEKSTYATYVGKKITIKLNKKKNSKSINNSKLVFSSSNKKIATISDKGVLTPKKKGTVKICVSLKNKPKTNVTCKVKIYSTQNEYKLQKFVGKWEIDSVKTNKENTISLIDMYGSGLTIYGASLKIGITGKFSYYIGEGVGGSGTCRIKNDKSIIFTIKTYEEKKKITDSITIKNSGNYLVMRDNDNPKYKIYWIRENNHSETNADEENNSDKNTDLSYYLGKNISSVDNNFLFDEEPETD